MNKKHILSAEVEPRTAATVRALARTNNLSVSEIVRRALAAWLRGNC